MEIAYKSKKVKMVCTDFKKAHRAYGERMAEKIHQRISELRAAESIDMLVQYFIGRCHALTGDRKGQYAMDLVHPQRLVFAPLGDGVTIIEIVDYH